jgi:hypothetical protein
MKACMIGMLVAMLAGMAAAQPVQWRVEDGGNGHWYDRLEMLYSSWEQCRGEAHARGAELVSVTSTGEQMIVNQVIARGQHPPGLAYWFGATAPSGTSGNSGWSWVDGSPWQYTFWNVNQPGSQVSAEARFIVQGGAPPVAGTGWHEYCSCDRIVCCWMRGAIIEWSADCNNDGIVDKGQILSGQLLDANNNGIPDGPGIVVQPTDQTVGVDASVTFIVEVAASTCSTPVTYQWQRRNPAVTDPQASGAWIDLSEGGGFLNTRSPALAIARPTPALATGYRCKIGGGCGCEPSQGGFVYTNTVNFSVACPADFNADGGIDFGDVEAFFERWENGC